MVRRGKDRKRRNNQDHLRADSGKPINGDTIESVQSTCF